MKDINKVLKDVLDYLDDNWDGTEDDAEDGYWEEMRRLHGPIVDYRMEAYHDVRVYEDGYEDRMYIGD